MSGKILWTRKEEWCTRIYISQENGIHFHSDSCHLLKKNNTIWRPSSWAKEKGQRSPFPNGTHSSVALCFTTTTIYFSSKRCVIATWSQWLNGEILNWESFDIAKRILKKKKKWWGRVERVQLLSIDLLARSIITESPSNSPLWYLYKVLTT